MSRRTSLICLALTHTIVDTCATLIAPLWPLLEQHYHFGMAGLSLAFIVQSMPTSVSQAVFGYFRDRRPAPVWLWLGPSIAAVFLTTIGLLELRLVLFALLILGGIGVGAFHPEAAVLAGRLIPENRTRGLSIFMFGGSLGLALGPALSGLVVDRWGIDGLVVLTVPLLVAIFILNRVGRLTQAASEIIVPDSAERPSIKEMLDGRVGLAMVMLLVCSLRLVPNMAMDKVLAFTLQQPHWGYSRTETGLVQGIFLVAASVGMFLMTVKFRSGWEKAFMVGCPLTGIPLMLVLGWHGCPPWLLFSTLALAGIVLWGTAPAMVSYAQLQFPKGAGLASALTMGMAWGIGGLIQAPLTSYFESAGSPQLTFVACTPFLLCAGVIAWFMPSCHVAGVDRETTDGSSQS